MAEEIKFSLPKGNLAASFYNRGGFNRGLLDDILVVFGKGKYIAGGLTVKRRILIIVLIGLVCGLWFYYKLGWDTIHIPLLFNFPEGIDLTIGFG